MSPLNDIGGCNWIFVPKEILETGMTEDPLTWVDIDIESLPFQGSLSLSTNSFTLTFIDNTDEKCVEIKFDTDQVTDITYQYDIDEDFKNPTESYSTVKQYISEVFSDFIVINTIPMLAIEEGVTDQELINQHILVTDAIANYVLNQIFDFGEIEVTTISDIKFSGIYCAENNEWIPIEEAKPNMKIYQTYDELPEFAPEGSVAYVTTNTEVDKKISQVNQLPFKMKFKENFAEIFEDAALESLTPMNYNRYRNNLAIGGIKKQYCLETLQTSPFYRINVFNINQIKVFQLDDEGGYTYLSGLTNENKDDLRLYFDKNNLNKELPSEDGWYNTNSKKMDTLDGAADTEEINILNSFQITHLDNDNEKFIDLKDSFSFINKYFDCKVSDCTQGLYYYQNRNWKAFTLNNIKDLTIWNNNLYYKNNSTSFDIGNPLRGFIEDWYQKGLEYDDHDGELNWNDGSDKTLSIQDLGKKGLPDVSANDNDSILKVVNGQWSKAASDLYIVTADLDAENMTLSNVSASVDNIYMAITDGKNVVFSTFFDSRQENIFIKFDLPFNNYFQIEGAPRSAIFSGVVFDRETRTNKLAVVTLSQNNGQTTAVLNLYTLSSE